jgi:hypothetical protein
MLIPGRHHRTNTGTATYDQDIMKVDTLNNNQSGLTENKHKRTRHFDQFGKFSAC